MTNDEKLLHTLCAGLPYGLCYDISETGYGKIEKHRLKECKLVSVSDSRHLTQITLKTNIESQNNGLLFWDRKVGKPLLHSLSMLTKPIVHGGEDIIAFNKLYMLSDYTDFLDELEETMESGLYMNWLSLPHELVQVLDSLHFNTRGLDPTQYVEAGDTYK